jgi:hypothetical protein
VVAMYSVQYQSDYFARIKNGANGYKSAFASFALFLIRAAKLRILIAWNRGAKNTRYTRRNSAR